jgi:hypothetical protein
MHSIEARKCCLAAAVDIASAQPFVWGTRDSPTFAFETRTLLTGGVDLASLWRGKYTTHLGGLRVMRRLGWPSLEAMGRALLGSPLDTPLLARRGDIVLTDSGLCFGVVIGCTAICRAPDGLRFVSLTACRLAWAF